MEKRALPPGTPQRVLVVDADKPVGMLLTKCLERRGHEVHVAESGERGLALLEQLEPDVVTSAIHLPDMTGFELAQAIRDSHGKQPYLIACTSTASSTVREDIAAAGFDHLIHKPICMETITRVVETRGTEES